MSTDTSTAQSALQMLDGLINKVSTLSVESFERIKSTVSTIEQSGQQAVADAKQSASSVAHSVTGKINKQSKSPASPHSQSASLPKPIFGTTADVAWWPQVPPGHTAFSWMGDSRSDSAAATTSHENTTHQQSHEPYTQAADAPSTVAQSKPKKQTSPQNKAKGNAAAAAKPTADPNAPDIARVDIRVGKITEAKKHPNADSLYIEMIDVGEEQPRQILSGLVKFVPLEEFIGSSCLVICNLKPSKMRGETSAGMVLAASNADKTKVELVLPPAGSKPGDRVTLEGVNVADFTADAQIDGKKEDTAWSRIRDKLATSSDLTATLDGKPLITSNGPLKAQTIANGTIS